jgi:hypothetical protein
MPTEYWSLQVINAIVHLPLVFSPAMVLSVKLQKGRAPKPFPPHEITRVDREGQPTEPMR